MPSYVYTNFDNETVEVEISEEIQDFLEADNRRVNREERQAKRYERHFNLYSWNNYNLFSVASCEDEYIDDIDRQAKENQEQKIINKILEVLDTCTPKQKERFLLYALQGYSYREIAKLEGKTHRAVEKTVEKVITKIRKSIF